MMINLSNELIIQMAFSITLAISLLVSVFAFDDLIIDIIAIFKNLKPKKLAESELAQMHNMPQKKFAIMIANWHEEDILERMIAGNIGRLDYLNYEFFLGVYPNDTATLQVALRLKEKYSRVQVVINSKDGPTSKGQMLNEIVNHIKAEEVRNKTIYDAFLLQDSEDIIHTLTLKLMNYRLELNDFVQIPVFSLPTPALDLVRGTYIDEFTESHTKDMLVRNHLKGGVPSAGVGTAMSASFVNDIMRLQNGTLLKQDTLTEDYHLGLMATRLGYRSEFSCYYAKKKNSTDYIATREFFPAKVATSIRQKARWTLGISLQGYDNLKWGSNFTQNYFLWRDRRGLINAPLLLLNYSLFIAFSIHYAFQGHLPDFIIESFLIKSVFAFNLFCVIVKLTQRFRLVSTLNGFSLAALIPVRWLLANYINTMASFKAVQNYRLALKTGQEPKWSKTAHELPVNFGLEQMTILEPTVANELTIIEPTQQPAEFPLAADLELNQTEDVKQLESAR